MRFLGLDYFGLVKFLQLLRSWHCVEMKLFYRSKKLTDLRQVKLITLLVEACAGRNFCECQRWEWKTCGKSIFFSFFFFFFDFFWFFPFSTTRSSSWDLHRPVFNRHRYQVARQQPKISVKTRRQRRHRGFWRSFQYRRSLRTADSWMVFSTADGRLPVL